MKTTEVEISNFYGWNFMLLTFYDYIEKFLTLGILFSDDKVSIFEDNEFAKAKTGDHLSDGSLSERSCDFIKINHRRDFRASELPGEILEGLADQIELTVLNLSEWVLRNYHSNAWRQDFIAFVIVQVARDVMGVMCSDIRVISFLKELYNLHEFETRDYTRYFDMIKADYEESGRYKNQFKGKQMDLVFRTYKTRSKKLKRPPESCMIVVNGDGQAESGGAVSGSLPMTGNTSSDPSAVFVDDDTKDGKGSKEGKREANNNSKTTTVSSSSKNRENGGQQRGQKNHRRQGSENVLNRERSQSQRKPRRQRDTKKFSAVSRKESVKIEERVRPNNMLNICSPFDVNLKNNRVHPPKSIAACKSASSVLNQDRSLDFRGLEKQINTSAQNHQTVLRDTSHDINNRETMPNSQILNKLGRICSGKRFKPVTTNQKLNQLCMDVLNKNQKLGAIFSNPEQARCSHRRISMTRGTAGIRNSSNCQNSIKSIEIVNERVIGRPHKRLSVRNVNSCDKFKHVYLSSMKSIDKKLGVPGAGSTKNHNQQPTMMPSMAKYIENLHKKFGISPPQKLDQSEMLSMKKSSSVIRKPPFKKNYSSAKKPNTLTIKLDRSGAACSEKKILSRKNRSFKANMSRLFDDQARKLSQMASLRAAPSWNSAKKLFRPSAKSQKKVLRTSAEFPRVSQKNRLRKKRLTMTCKKPKLEYRKNSETVKTTGKKKELFICLGGESEMLTSDLMKTVESPELSCKACVESKVSTLNQSKEPKISFFRESEVKMMDDAAKEIAANAASNIRLASKEKGPLQLSNCASLQDSIKKVETSQFGVFSPKITPGNQPSSMKGRLGLGAKGQLNQAIRSILIAGKKRSEVLSTSKSKKPSPALQGNSNHITVINNQLNQHQQRMEADQTLSLTSKVNMIIWGLEKKASEQESPEEVPEGRGTEILDPRVLKINSSTKCLPSGKSSKPRKHIRVSQRVGNDSVRKITSSSGRCPTMKSFSQRKLRTIRINTQSKLPKPTTTAKQTNNQSNNNNVAGSKKRGGGGGGAGAAGRCDRVSVRYRKEARSGGRKIPSGRGGSSDLRKKVIAFTSMNKTTRNSISKKKKKLFFSKKRKGKPRKTMGAKFPSTSHHQVPAKISERKEKSSVQAVVPVGRISRKQKNRRFRESRCSNDYAVSPRYNYKSKRQISANFLSMVDSEENNRGRKKGTNPNTCKSQKKKITLNSSALRAASRQKLEGSCDQAQQLTHSVFESGLSTNSKVLSRTATTKAAKRKSVLIRPPSKKRVRKKTPRGAQPPTDLALLKKCLGKLEEPKNEKTKLLESEVIENVSQIHSSNVAIKGAGESTRHVWKDSTLHFVSQDKHDLLSSQNSLNVSLIKSMFDISKSNYSKGLKGKRQKVNRARKLNNGASTRCSYQSSCYSDLSSRFQTKKVA